MSFEEFVPGRSWRGLKQIKLDSGSSYSIQQRLGYWVYRQYSQPASRQSSCRFVLNLGGSDDYRGCYGIEEVVKKAFIRYRWPNLANVTGNLYKLDNQTSTWSVDSYRWRGTDPALYVPIPFSPKTNEVGGDYRDIVNLCNVLNNVPLSSRRAELERIMNVDRHLSILAVCSTVGDSDGLFNNMRELNNHYWYHREDTNKLEVIPWDVDGSFVYQPSDTSAWKWFYETRTSQGGNNPSVLNAWVPNDRVARESFAAKVREVVAGPLSSARSRADFIYNQIKSHVYADPYKPITNAEFDAKVQAIKDWISRRITFLQTEMAIPTVTIAAVDGTGSEPGTDTMSFRVSRTGATSAPLTVDLTFGGTATHGTDTNTLPTSVTIARGQSSVTVTVTPKDDAVYEGAETVVVTLAAHSSYTVGTASSVTLTIADNESPPATLPTVTITASDPNASESGDTGAFTVTRTGSTASSLTVRRQRSGSAVSPDDYNPLPSPFVIPAGQASVVITVTPVNDTAVEGAETVVVTLTSDPAYTVGTANSATVTVADNDAAPPPTLPTVTITASDPNASESGDTGAFTVTRTGSTASSLTVRRQRSGSAVSPDDYTPLPSPFVIPAGQASVVITVTPVNDTAVEGNETLVVTLLADAAYTLGSPSSATVTIADNDSAGAGISGTYYDNENFTGTSVTRTDPAIDFDWASQSPAAGIGADTFSCRWTGRVRPTHSETYTFYTFTNDGVRLWVDGELLVDHWVQQSGGIEWSAQMTLQSGRWYTLQMDHYEGVGNAVARLSWSSPSTPKQVVPQSALSPALGDPDSRDNDGDGTPNDADLDDDNDGIPDLQDSDRDGDGASNVLEAAGGTDPDDGTSFPAGGGSGGGGGGGGGCGATGLEALVFLALLVCGRSLRRARVT